jgi:hypothetical protein
MFSYIKYYIRVLAIKFYDKTDHFIVPKDLFSRISLNHDNPEELQKIKTQIQELKSKFPYERSFDKALAVIERMGVLGK